MKKEIEFLYLSWQELHDLCFQMVKKINIGRLSHRVSLKGQIPYLKFSNAIKPAHVFVGMGTCIIEAAFCKVACVTSIESDENITIT